MDTADVVIEDNKTGEVFASTTMQLAGLSGTNATEELRGGIANKVLAILKTDKTLDLTLRDALFNTFYLRAAQGMEIEADGTTTVTYAETLSVVDGAVTPTRTPVGDISYVNDAGETVTAVAEGGAVTVAETTGQTKVYYDVDVTGDTMTFEADKFSRNYKITLRTIAYDPAEMSVEKEIFMIFDNCSPTGDFDMSFEAGTAISPEITFSVLAPQGGNEMGRLIIADYVA